MSARGILVIHIHNPCLAITHRVLYHTAYRKQQSRHCGSLEQRHNSRMQGYMSCFYYRMFNLCQYPLVKIFVQADVPGNFQIGEQRLIAKQMCRNFFLTEESPKNLLFLYRGFTIPVTLQQLFNVLIIHKCLFHHILTGSAFGPGRGLLLPVPQSDA